MVAKLLEMPQLVDEDGVAKMKVRRCRIEAGLDAQGSAQS